MQPHGAYGFLIGSMLGFLAGRTFEETRHDGMHEALIDHEMAKYFFGDRSPLAPR